jgi:hypothetical protein
MLIRGLLLVCVFLLLGEPDTSLGKEIGYSYQLYTSESEFYARRFYENLPEELKEEAYVYITDRGLFTVRFGFAKSLRGLEGELQKLNKYGLEAVAVITDRDKLVKEEGEAEQEEREETEHKSNGALISELIKERIREIENGEREPPKGTNGKALSVLTEELEEVQDLIKQVFFGGNNRYMDMLLLNEIDNKGIALLQKKAEINRRSPLLYLVGELRYREEASLLEDEELAGNFYSYVGLKLSLLKEGFGERRYKERIYNFQCLAEGIFRRVDYAYTYLLGNQVEGFRESFSVERERILSSKGRFVSFARELLERISALDKQYKFLQKVIFAGADLHGWDSEEIPVRENYRILPPFDINMGKLFDYMELRRKEVLGKLDEYLRREDKVGWSEVLREAELDFIIRYHITDYGSEDRLRDYFSVGVRFDIPVPYLYSQKKEAIHLELRAIKEKVIQRLDKEHSQIVDMAFRLKQNFLHIRNHLEYINQDLLKIKKNLFLWKFGAGKVNYRELVESFLDIYDRLLLVNNYKYINYVYAQKITYLLDISDRRVLMSIFNF